MVETKFSVSFCNTITVQLTSYLSVPRTKILEKVDIKSMIAQKEYICRGRGRSWIFFDFMLRERWAYGTMGRILRRESMTRRHSATRDAILSVCSWHGEFTLKEYVFVSFMRTSALNERKSACYLEWKFQRGLRATNSCMADEALMICNVKNDEKSKEVF